MKKFLTSVLLFLLAVFTFQEAAAQLPVATPEQAITGLLNRIGGNGAAEKFVILIDASLSENGKDVFVITSQEGKPCIKGNNQLSVAAGINWYLNHYAHINLTWNNLTTDLTSVELPVPTTEEKHVCNTTYRYNFNTCTFSYSMAFWTWERWQKEIDWMALHGINAPLNLVGLDVVTRNFLKELGISDKDINAYIAGPGFIAWFAMNNLEGWGGTINATDVKMNGNPDWWYTRQEQLCKNMLQRMRELGMQPVIPGFSGQVPNCIVNYKIEGFNSGDVINNGNWAGGYTRPDILNPASNSYATLAPIYYKHLEAIMGVSELYSMDPFHEGSLPSGVSNTNCYPNIMKHLDNYFDEIDSDTKTSFNVGKAPAWIIQYWQGVPQSGAFSAMSSYGNRFIALDLFSDAPGKAKWNTDYFKGRPYIFCMLHNFGGRSGMHGRLESTMNDYFSALAKGNNMQGIGATPEGTETNPILYDMLFELPWIDPDNRPTADEWIADYAHARYGIDNETALAALQNLKNSVWACPTDQQGTSEAVILARPAWTVNNVSSWSTSAIYWDTQDVLLAADQLVSINELITTRDGINNYNYDVIDVIRQSMVDYAAELLPLINSARNSGNDNEYTRLYKLYLQLMLDLDTMLSYDENFKLERWTSLARNIAGEVNGTTTNDRNWLEWNARTQVTVWSKGNTDLHDYSNRCWAGLIKDFHYERWKYFFENNGAAPSGGWYTGFEYPWTVDFTNHDYSTLTIPNDMTATEKAVETFGKYFGRLKGETKNYIFPMGVTRNATKSNVIPEVNRGQVVELPLEIGKDVTITRVWIDLNADGAESNNESLDANGMNVSIPEDATIGKTTATVTFSDNTSITFNLAIVEEITKERTVTAVAGANGSVAIEGSNNLSVTNKEAVRMIATANTGYNFEKWTDSNGKLVSNDNPFIYYGKNSATFTANFIQDKWGVVESNGHLSEDIAGYGQYIQSLTLTYYNREAETIFETTTAPATIFNTIPQIVDVPRGASFNIAYDNGNSDGLKFCYMRAFIDLNADGDFDDEGELVKEVGSNGAQNTAVCKNNINILLPYDMPLGITHLRLRFDGAWENSGKPAEINAKAPSIRPVYEIIINVTEFSDKAAHIKVETNNDEWGTVKVWTDETPDGATRTEWDVTKGVPFYIEAEKSSEDVEFLGLFDQYGRLVTSDYEYTAAGELTTGYKMNAREDATYTAKFRKFLEIDGWHIEYRSEGSNIILTKVQQNGNNDLKIPETVKVLGEDMTIVGFENNLFNNNKDLWSINLPKSIEFLSIKSLISGTMRGSVESGSGTVDPQYYTVYNLDETLIAEEGFEVTVKGISDGSTYNQWGSGLFSSGTDPLAATYNGGFQFYLGAAGNFILKIAGSAEEKLDNTECKVIANTPFTAKIKYRKGTISIIVDNGAGEEGTFTKSCKINNITAFSAAIPKGITLDINVTSMSAEEADPFKGCSNLDAITIDSNNKNYYVDANGDLYNSNNRLVCSPAGKAKGADRRALAALIEKMRMLTSYVATYNTSGKVMEIPLQTKEGSPYYIFCNNPDTQEGQGVAGLLDDDNNTYLHSNWHNVSQSNDYLQVELGAGNELDMFKIAGVQRSGAQADFPKTIEILGSNDKINWEPVATVNNLPQSAGTSWTSETIASTKKYANLRFVVTTGTNRKYFHLSKFDLFKVSSSADVYAHLEDAITDTQAANAFDVLVNAEKSYNNATTAQEMQKAKAELQDAYDTLEALLEAKLPVALTTDERNPILYNIFIKRNADVTLLVYEEQTKQIAVENTTDNNSYQAWYFTGSKNGICIHPYNADGKLIGVDNTDNAPATVWVAEKGEKKFQEWIFLNRDNGYYNIQIYNGSNYLSNNGGIANKMGLWNGSPERDNGSLFKFVKAEFDNDNPRYYQLKDFQETLTVDGSSTITGTFPGCYTTGGDEYYNAYTTATRTINSGNSEAALDCFSVYTVLRKASDNLGEMIMPEDGKAYRIRSFVENTENEYKTHYITNSNASITFPTTAIDNSSLWICRKNGESYEFVSALGTAAFGYTKDATTKEAVAETPAAYTLTGGISRGSLTIATGDTRMGLTTEAHSSGLGFGYSTEEKCQLENWSTDWFLEPVEDIEITFSKSFSSGSSWETIYLPYAVIIPDNITAYIAEAKNVDNTEMSIALTAIEEVIPAYTPVLLNSKDKNDSNIYLLEYTREKITEPAENILKGKILTSYVTEENAKFYQLMSSTDGEGFYWVKAEYNANGTHNAEGGTHIKCEANKVYLSLSDETGSSFYKLKIADNSSTSIEEINCESRKAIYDLCGRRVTEITQPGFYIVNGKKVLIK